MHRFLSGAALSAILVAGNVAPALANSKNVNTDGEVTANSVASNLDLVEIEGRTLTDAEAAEIQGEAIPVFLLPVLLKAAAASATKTAVIGFGKAAITATLVGGRFVLKNAAGGVIGGVTYSYAQSRGWVR